MGPGAVAPFAHGHQWPLTPNILPNYLAQRGINVPMGILCSLALVLKSGHHLVLGIRKRREGMQRSVWEWQGGSGWSGHKHSCPDMPKAPCGILTN